MTKSSKSSDLAPNQIASGPAAEPKYQSARGCLAMLGIAILVLGVSVLLMYLFAEPAVRPTP